MQGGHVLEVAGRDERGRGVAQHRQQHLGQRAGVAAGEVRDGEDGDARQAQAEAGQPAYAEAFGVTEEAGQDHADDRHAGDQQPGGGAGQVALGVGQGPPRADDLDGGEGQQGLPVRPYGAGQAASAQGEG
nr:hypothetical protein [Streptomyces griseicoloratus]